MLRSAVQIVSEALMGRVTILDERIREIPWASVKLSGPETSKQLKARAPNVRSRTEVNQSWFVGTKAPRRPETHAIWKVDGQGMMRR